MNNSDDINLSDYSVEELEKLQNRVGTAIKDAEVKKRSDAIAAAEKIARDAGLTLEELVTMTPTGRKRRAKSSAKVSAAPKYANPNNPDQTWTGKGRQPGWARDHVESGKSIKDLEI